MKHNWQPHPDSCTARMPFRRVRYCLNCGTQQERVGEYWWGRVIDYSWWPKVGRCGKQPPNTVRPIGAEL